MTPGINTLLLSTGVLGSFTCSGMTLPIYMGPTALRGIRATGDTLSNVESQVFTPYKFGSTAGDRTPNLLPTRPTCYHSAAALCSDGVADGLLQRLQCAQDWAARTVLQLPRSVEAPLHDLHWLPVSSRIDYKLAVTAFRAKHGLAPDYINELVWPHSVSRTLRLRSTGANLLHVPKSNIVKGDRAFMIAGPKVWNSLRSNIRTITNLVDFKKKLKTH